MKVLFDFAPRILDAFKRRRQRNLRRINDDVIKAAALDPNNISLRLATLSYVLSKILSKPRFLDIEFEKCMHRIDMALERLVRVMRSRDEKKIIKIFFQIEDAVACFDRQDPRFVIGLIEKGRLKMAATFYAQGMSLGRASEMTGIEKQEILDYAGHTMMFDRIQGEKTIKERMKTARKLVSE